MDVSSGRAALARILAGAKRAVFFGGAGVSTESGIPDFRSPDGLYSQSFDVPPETVLSADFFRRRTEKFYEFYRTRMLCPGARPNAAHRALAALERRGILSAVITQNIDGLHRKAGSKNVFELHGNADRNVCLRCGRVFDAAWILSGTGVPRCPCGGLIKPDVVLYGEALDEAVLSGAIRAVEEADVLIVAGTSLTVYPAAGLVPLFRGEHLVLINRTPTPMDDLAELILRDPVGEVLAPFADGEAR